MDRRGFLKVSAVTGSVLAAGSSLLMSGCSDHYDAMIPSGLTPQTLSGKEFAILCTLVNHLIPDEPGHPTVRDTRVAQRIDRELAFHQGKMIDDFKAALLLVEHGGVAHGTFTRFSRMTSEEQEQRLAQMVESALEVERQAFASIRLMAVFFHYTDERTWPHIHYAGPLIPVPNPPPADNRRA
ncbi:MAG: gluconate 2-dehydrogenase subunit 3 family protein [Myxococcota bacterium]